MPQFFTLSLLIVCLAGVCTRRAAVQALLDRGAEINERDQLSGRTPLHVAASNNEPPALLALLLDCGADPKLQDKAEKLSVDYAEQNENLKGTAVYWRLYDARF